MARTATQSHRLLLISNDSTISKSMIARTTLITFQPKVPIKMAVAHVEH